MVAGLGAGLGAGVVTGVVTGVVAGLGEHTKLRYLLGCHIKRRRDGKEGGVTLTNKF